MDTFNVKYCIYLVQLLENCTRRHESDFRSVLVNENGRRYIVQGLS